MKTYLIILLIILGTVLAARSFFSVEWPQLPSTQNRADLVTKTSSGNITVEVTPVTLSSGQSAKFKVTFTTHSGDPKYDLSISELKDETGQIYPFASWEGNTSGHHVSGNLTFTPLKNLPRLVTLTIKNIDGSDRTFIWNLQ